MKSVTLSVNSSRFLEIKSYYSSFEVTAKGEYVDFIAIKNDVQITGYQSKKEKKTITFVGELALQEALIWDENATLNTPKKVLKEEWVYLEDQIGSDEVGVGDFLLPMIVVAAFVKKEQIPLLKKYGIHDSKKMSDAQILEVGPQLVKEFAFSKLTLSNEKYNEMVAKGENLNSMKAKMHNRALFNLHKENPDVLNVFIDEFVASKTYYNYLKEEKEIVKDIISRTKGESHFPSVALASVIARYSFLKEKEKLEEKYQMAFPFGANQKVDKFVKNFVAKFGLSELDKIVKKNFANYREVLANALL